jgi:hypothetical protein
VSRYSKILDFRVSEVVLIRIDLVLVGAFRRVQDVGEAVPHQEALVLRRVPVAEVQPGGDEIDVVRLRQFAVVVCRDGHADPVEQVVQVFSGDHLVGFWPQGPLRHGYYKVIESKAATHVVDTFSPHSTDFMMLYYRAVFHVWTMFKIGTLAITVGSRK